MINNLEAGDIKGYNILYLICFEIYLSLLYLKSRYFKLLNIFQ